jgi:class 3 adenylate cyclase
MTARRPAGRASRGGIVVAATTPASHANGFLFADLRDYTRFAETHGDHAAAELLTLYRALVRAEVERHAGAEIRTEGDSFYVVFPSASAAIRCGLAILEAARSANEQVPERPLRVGIGVHAGETAETAEGFVGSAVNIAARVCSQAKAGELLVTDIVRGLTRTSLPYGFVPIGTRRLKGIAEPIALYRVLPEGAAVSALQPGIRIRGLAGRFAGLVLAGLVVVAIIAAGLVTVAALNLPGGNQGNGSPSPSNVALGSPTTAPSAAEATFPTSAEKELLSRLPTTVHQEGQTNCARSGTDAAAGATVSIRCDLPITADASAVFYDQFAGQAAMDTVFLALESRYRLVKGDCSSQPAAWQHWELTGSFSGTLLCYQDENGHVWTTWTYDGSFVLARGFRDDANAQKLHGWWKSTSALMLR